MLVTPGPYPRRKHLKGAPIGLALDLPSNSITLLERVSKDKPSSLLGPIVSDEGKKFYNIDTCCRSYKTFSSSSQTIRPNKPERLLGIIFYPVDIKLGWKGLAGKNALAFLVL